jgi:hypothetical protein
MLSRRLRYKLVVASVAIAVIALNGVALTYGSRENSASCGALTVILLVVTVVLYLASKLGVNTLFR